MCTQTNMYEAQISSYFECLLTLCLTETKHIFWNDASFDMFWNKQVHNINRLKWLGKQHGNTVMAFFVC